jgi:adenylate cyclase
MGGRVEGGSMDRTAGTASLSRRELQIARAYAAGSGYRDIADQLFIAPSTVRTHLSTIYRKLGVSSKVDLLRVLEGSQEASRRLRYSAHEKPSIAVLPFANMSVDPDQEYFSDGITEDLITDLSKLPNISVIARNSTFTFKGQAVNVVEAGRRLGARYVVEGSVRRAGNRLRITAQLIEAETGHHLWAER